MSRRIPALKWPSNLVIVRHAQSGRNVWKEIATAKGLFSPCVWDARQFGGGQAEAMNGRNLDLPDGSGLNRTTEQAFDNRFRHGQQKFEVDFTVAGTEGIPGARFATLILDEKIGPESVLMLRDPTPFAYELKRESFDLHLKNGVAQTSMGPILFLLWWLPPITSGKPFALFEQLLNPARKGFLEGLNQLARQTHLHVLLVGPRKELLGVYEFRNVFGFDEFIWFVERACREYVGMDFHAAHAEYERTYDVMELFHLEGSETDQSIER